MVPNMMKIMGNSPALLEGALNLADALNGGSLGPQTGELIALAVAESNSCNYCLSAHTFVGANILKMDAETIKAARKGNAADAKTDAVLKFAKLLVEKRGSMNDADVSAALSAGISQGEVGEIIGHVAFNTLTNYFNKTAQTELDHHLVAQGA